VLVTGTTGAVGSAAASIADINGARVLGTVRSRGESAIRNDLSFVEWIDLESRPLPKSVKELTGGKGADLILDVVGGPLFQP
jgi:NADPH:quinone reductase